MRFKRFFDSFARLREASPMERLGRGSRYAIVSDLLLGSGGRDDPLARRGGLALSVLGSYYLPERQVLVLNGDTENLRDCWYKDIQRAWGDLYSVLDAFVEAGRLRKILGERDLGLMRKPKPRHPAMHGLRLMAEDLEILVIHGHQAARRFSGMDYRDFILRQMEKPVPVNDEGDLDGGERLLRLERRLELASRRLGIATVFGHTGRSMFASRTDYDDLRGQVERLLSKGEGEGGRSLLDSVFQLYRREIERCEKAGQMPGMTLHSLDGSPLLPGLFNPGFAAARKGLNVLELDAGGIRTLRWIPHGKAGPATRASSLRIEALPDIGLDRCILKEMDLQELGRSIRSARVMAPSGPGERAGAPA